MFTGGLLNTGIKGTENIGCHGRLTGIQLQRGCGLGLQSPRVSFQGKESALFTSVALRLLAQ